MEKVAVRNADGDFIRFFDILVRLPWGTVITLAVHHDMTVQELKSSVEKTSGLPASIFHLSDKMHHALNKGDTLHTLLVTQGTQFKVWVSPGLEALVLATFSGDEADVIRHLSRCKDATKRSSMSGVALYLSAHAGHYDILERLLPMMSTNHNFETLSLRTPLHAACACGNTACTERLLQHGFSHTLEDIDGKTPRQLAIRGGHHDIQLHVKQHPRRTDFPKYDRVEQPNFSMFGSWSTMSSSEFPISRLGRSVSPVIALRELSIQPSPRIMDDAPSEDRGDVTERNVDGLESSGSTRFTALVPKRRPKTAPALGTRMSSHHHSPREKSDRRGEYSRTSLADYNSNDMVQSELFAENNSSVSVDASAASCPRISAELGGKDMGRTKSNLRGFHETGGRGNFASARSSDTPPSTRAIFRPRTAPPHNRRQRASQEERDRVFRAWLRNKTQGVRDDRLIRRVSGMLNSALGRTDKDDGAIGGQEENNPTRKGLTYEEWIRMKNEQRRREKMGSGTETRAVGIRKKP